MTRVLGVLVALLGAVVFVAGWVGESATLRSLVPEWVTMKASTALCFVLLGVGILAARARKPTRGWAHMVTSTCSVLVLVLMAGLAVQSLTGIPVGLDDVFVREQHARLSVGPGIPSLLTIACDALAALCLLCMSESDDPARCRLAGRVFAPVVMVTAIVAWIGYALDIPALYGYVPDVSTAMAAHTALGVFAVGAALWRLADRQT